MANDLTGRVHTVDIAAVVTTGPVWITKMIWDEPAAAADDLTVKDGAGDEIWDLDARNYGNGVQEVWNSTESGGSFFSGLNVSVIDSGTLYIYYA